MQSSPTEHDNSGQLARVAVIPAYNEEQSAAQIVRSVKHFVDEVYVIDDGSSDATGVKAKEAGARVIRHEKNTGIAGALNSGYRAALACKPEFVVQLDADGQHDPDLIPLLLGVADELTDIVIGSRFLGRVEGGYSLPRRWGIRFFSFLTNLLGGARLSDVTSGYRIYRRSALAMIPQSRGRHWAVEQTLCALRLDLTIKEVAIPMPPRTLGQSQFRPDVALLYPIRILMGILRALYHTRRTQDIRKRPSGQSIRAVDLPPP